MVHDPDPTPAESHRFGRFLLILVVAFIVSGFGDTWALAVGVGLTALLTLVAFSSGGLFHDRPRKFVIGAVALGAAGLIVLIRDDSAWRAVPMLIQAALLSLFVWRTVSTALHRVVVDTQTILAAISAYVLIGFAYSWTYLAIDTVDDNQLSMASTASTEFFEFSFIVQTTVGFGNQIPYAPFAARVVVTQAVLGQLFLAILVARLVSLYGARPGGRREPDDQQ